jgi:hypothetical protein
LHFLLNNDTVYIIYPTEIGFQVFSSIHIWLSFIFFFVHLFPISSQEKKNQIYSKSEAVKYENQFPLGILYMLEIKSQMNNSALPQTRDESIEG